MINLISDTVTKPTSGMLKAMMSAEVGDDVFDSDPTVNALQEKAADLFGVEGALFCPSGTMTNQIAIKAFTQPGDEVICHHYAHIYNYESGGTMANSGVSVKLIGNPDGRFTAEQAAAVVSNPDAVYMARTRMIEVENTSNKGGGTCYTLPELHAIGEVAKANKLAYYLDGARLFNALTFTGEKPADYGKSFDAISVCLSKGLGCPVGSLLLGNSEFIREAKYLRKRMGGGWRQAGFLAAAGIYALDNNIERLHEDHEKASKLATCLTELDYVEKVEPAQTNIVIFTLKDQTKEEAFFNKMKEAGVLLISMGQGKLRMVTHLDVSMAEIENVCGVLRKVTL